MSNYGILLVLFSVALSAQSKSVICYYESWSYYNGFTPDKIDGSICTHVNFAFFGIQPNGGLRWIVQESLVVAVAQLKKTHPNIKLLISVGGWTEGSTNFSIVANHPELSLAFAHGAKAFLDKYNYDGVDIDWEYPGRRGGNPADRAGFVNLLRTLKHTIGEGRLVTTAVNSDPAAGDYDVAGISNACDFVNVMTYDFHCGSRTVGQNSPLYAGPHDSEWDKNIGNVASAVHNWIKHGTDPRKLVLGLPFYGYAYKLTNPNDFYEGAKIAGTGKSGGSYEKICSSTNKFTSRNWIYVYDDVRKVPYMHNHEEVVVYDNEQSIREKVLYANRMNLAGVMMWAVDQDARGGACGYLTLLKTIKQNLK